MPATMWPPPRPPATDRRIIAIASAVLLAIAACSDDSTSSDAAAATTGLTSPVDATVDATGAAPSVLTIERLWSPENAIAEMTGRGTPGSGIVTVDGVETTPESFDVADGGFTMRVEILEEGAHTVCLDDTCGRVYTLAADAETIEDVEAKIDEAIVIASERFDFAAAFPEWRIVTAGPMSGTGGSIDPASRTIVINANRNRPLDEFVVTILHEWGHVVDEELLTNEDRTAYRALRGIDPALPWRTGGFHDVESWGRQPSEDFAEVMAMIWTDGEHLPRTEQLAPTPDDAALAAVVELLDGRI